MKASLLKVLVVFLAVVTFAAVLAACSGEASKLAFSEESVTIYLSESDTLTPVVDLFPKKSTYTLTTSNETAVKVNEDGVSLTALRAPAIVTVTATSGELSATMTVKVIAKRAETDATDGNYEIKEELYTVVFITNYGGVPDVTVVPGEKITEPDMDDQIIGQMLEGWYTERDCQNRFDFETGVNSNLILYANWIPISSPLFNYAVYNNTVYITGFYYTYLKYIDVTFPSVVPEGTVVGVTDISGRAVGGIYEEACAEKTSLKTVTFPDTYIDIKANAFAKCTALTTVTFSGESFKTIGAYAFQNCTALTSCVLPDSVSEIGLGAFDGCSLLSNIGGLPQSLTTITTKAFSGTAITEIDLSNVTTLNSLAFYGCTALATVTGGEGLSTVGTNVFENAAFLIAATEASVDGAVYLNKVLLSFTKKENVNTIYINADCNYIAGGALNTLTARRTFVFSSAEVPVRAEYGISTSNENIDLVVPKAYYDAYVSAWNVNANAGQIYYAESPEDGLSLKVAYTVKDEVKTYAIVVDSYVGSAETLDLNAIFTANYTDGSFKIKRISATAFSGYASETVKKTLKTVVLCPVIAKIERNAFNNLSALETIKIAGDFGSYKPSDTTLTSTAINPLYADWVLSVPTDYEEAYKSAWTAYAGRVSKY